MKEYGGYLPLELRDYGEYFRYSEFEMQRYYSGRSALYYALKQVRPLRVHIPYYICNSVKEVLNKLNIPFTQYHIDVDFIPVDLIPEPDECVVLVNYFGVLDRKISYLSERYVHVIIDNTQAFFALPIMRCGVLNVYSCRKFIGVSDGAYLIGHDLKEWGLCAESSSHTAGFLLESLEFGTNECYAKSKANEAALGDKYGKMSVLTQRILNSVDYDNIKQKRRENYVYLYVNLLPYNQINLPLSGNNEVPYLFPFMTKISIQHKLVANRVYTPILWSELLETNDAPLEKTLAEKMSFLPVDQRYSLCDMKTIVEIIKEIMKEFP